MTSGFGRPSQSEVPSFVVDPGVFVASWIAPNGSPAHLVRAAFSGRFVLITSPHLIAELTDVVHRDKFRSGFSRSAADQMLRAVRQLAEQQLDPDVSNRKPVCRDLKHDYRFVLAEASGATLLVSGDRDVLETSSGAVAVMSPREALDSIR